MNVKDKSTENPDAPIHLTTPPILLPPHVPGTDNKPLDRVKPPTDKKRSRELER